MSLLGAGLSTSMPRGDSVTECLREELADASDVDERVLLHPVTNFMKPLMVTLCCTHSKTNTSRVFFASGRTIYRRVEQTRICGEFSEIFGVDFGGRIFQSSNLCFWVKNLKNISKELSEERTCERGAPEHLKRGQAGRPRAFLALLHFIFLWWLPGAIICFCPVHLSCFAPSKSCEPLLLCL